MLKSYLTLVIRNISRSFSYALINVSGLALGIACVLLIFSLVTYHLSFDNFHSKSDRVYRFVTEQHRDQVSYNASVPPAFGKVFREDYTFGEKVARLYTARESLISFEDGNALKKFKEEVAFAEPEFFDIFNFPLQAGSAKGLLTEPNTTVVTERIAKKYFGNESALDKTIRFENLIDLKIIGILKDIPDNTDLHAEIYCSFVTAGQYNPWYTSDDAWGGITSEIQTFGRLREGVTPAEVEAVLPDLVKKFRPKSKNVHHYKLQRLDDMHFNGQYGGVMSKTVITILSVIGLLLMITACLNFINLATAQAVTRSKEVGVRKSLGGTRPQLFWQFALETSVIVILATFVAFAAAYTVLPYVNELLETRVHFDLLSDTRLLLFIPMLMLVVTFLSCAYPGMILSGFKPALAMKNIVANPSSGNFNLRRTLITVQFTISQILLIGLIVVIAQMKYVKRTDLGFDQSAIVMIPTGSSDQKTHTLRDKLLQIPHIQNVTSCFQAPSSENVWNTTLRYDNRTEDENFSVAFRGGDENYIATFGIKLIAGRNLEPSDTVREFLVNETFVSKLGLSSPEEILGRNIRVNGNWTGPVVGVVKDFHDRSLHSDITPLFITTDLENYHAYGIKIDMNDSKNTLAALEKTWLEIYPELIYQYHFLDELTAQFYQTEETILQLVQVFSFIALFIGCMGLYGLVSFMAVQRTKEIGIRKVLGGSVSHILWIFGKEFSMLVLVAFMLAAPVGWFVMSSWLERYTFHTDITASVFIAELAIITAVVLITVGYKAARSALTNPVNALRTE